MTTDQLLKVHVSAARSGTAQATWGQQAIWDAVSGLGADAPRYNLMLPVELDPGRPLPEVLDDLTALLHLHESLRTRLRPDESGGLRQILDGEGDLPVALWNCPPEEADRQRDALLADLLGRPFDTARQWPVRAGLVECDGLVRHLVLVLSHTASDGWGIRRLHQDVIDLGRGLTVARIRARRPSLQPLDEAALQASDRGRRRDVAARRHWCERLEGGAARLFTSSGAEPDDPARLLPNARLHSPALAHAVEQVAAGRGVSTSSVLLAALAVQQSRLSGAEAALLQVVVNNRFLPTTAQAVSTMAQEGLFHLPSARGRFTEVLRRAHLAALGCYRHAAYDRRLLTRDLAELGRVAGPLADRSCTFNDARIVRADAAPTTDPPPLDRPPRDRLDRLREQTRLSWPVEFPPRADFTFALDAVLTPGALELAMTADSALISRAGMERLLYGVEELIVDEAVSLGRDRD
ncbi:condensation domain-containing protein [Streptacidiphilus rugosus]|uniref:condensation domain-containing protein n=1 Tax=Streptacidiphilus rugosus TaxID=405783 RepID=UPI00055BDAD7|nr:condensation domain-containing protein [Streptacidiphilus rugosus]